MSADRFFQTDLPVLPDDNIILEIELREAHKEFDAIIISDYAISNKMYYLLDG